MSDGTVYIPTMDRYANLEKIIPYWLEQDIEPRLIVEADERAAHFMFLADMGWRKSVRIIPVPRDGQGIGFARRYAVRHAKLAGLKSIIMSDDDMRPDHASNYHLLLEEAGKPGVLGIGAVRSIHDRFTGGAVSRNTGVILCPGGWGFQMFGLNVRTAEGLGSFDPLLHSYGEDGELARQGISRGYPWRVHCDVKTVAIGKRYAVGGISARFTRPQDRTEAEVECLTLIHDRWPAYTNRPDRPLRVAWQKMLDHYIPEWRELSAIHGGHL
jgi:hypothetical protein